MTHAQIYAPADHTTEWAQANFARGTFTTVEKLLLHSTETVGFPGYGLGCAMAPTVTYHARERKWRQHNYIGSSARSLEDPTSTPVRENRDNVVQVEIVAYSDAAAAKAAGGLLIHDLTEANLADLGAFAGWLHVEWDLPLQSPIVWRDYPASYGIVNGVRLTSAGYDSYRGILGHQHASGNHHGDPGVIAVAKIIDYAKAYVARVSTPAPPSRGTTRPPIVAPHPATGPVITVANVRPGHRNADVKAFNALLWAHMGAVYKKAMGSRWMSESADLYGPVSQKVCLDLYRWLHATNPKVWGPAPSAPAWPGPALVRHLGGVPK